MTILYNGNPDGLLTYTSPSPKLCMGPSGTYRYGPHNLYVNSASPANQSITVVSGAAYTVVITGSVSVTASGAATGTWTAGTTNFTAATGTLTLGSTSGAGTVHVRRTNSDTTYLQTGASARYGLPFEWSTAGALQGILVEGARTNLVTRSNFSTTDWAAINGAGTNNGGTDPTGASGATLWTWSGGGSGRAYSPAFSASTGTNYTVSAFVWQPASNSHRYVKLYVRQSNEADAGWGDLFSFDLQTGTVAAGGAACSIVAANGGYRISVTSQMTAGTSFRLFIGPCDATGSGVTSTNAVLAWGAQVEPGSFATSPIETFGATVTRAADNISLATSAFPYSAAAGTLFAQFSASNSDMTSGSAYYAAALDDGSLNNTIGLYRYQTNIGAAVAASGATQSDQYRAPGSPTSPHKDAVSFASNNIRQATDGVLSTPDTSATIPTVTKLSLSRANSNQINGYLAKLMYLPRAMTNAELQALTT